MWASQNGFTDIVRELIAADGSVEHLRMQNIDGWTALMYASFRGRTDVVRELIAADGSAEHLRMKNIDGVTALSLASQYGQTDVVRELVAADGSAEHLRMKDKRGRTALVYAVNDEITALLTAAEAAADAGAAAPPPEGKAREGEEENQEEDSPPPQTQGGAQPKKTLPRPVYEGDADALVEVLAEARREGEEPDIAKVRELLDAGIDIRYQVRVHCVFACIGGRVLTRTSESMDVVRDNAHHHTVGLTSLSLCSPSPSFPVFAPRPSFDWIKERGWMDRSDACRMLLSHMLRADGRRP